MLSHPNTRLCIPVHESTVDALKRAANEVSRDADIIELRVDALSPDQVDDRLHEVIRELSKPVILTFRPYEQGGYRELSLSERKDFWQRHFESPAAFFDLEADLVAELIDWETDKQPDWSKVICSHHDFGGLPTDLESLFERMSFTPARILKFAFKANEIVDSVPVLKLLSWAHKKDREIIALSMGEAGVITRIVGPSLGSFLSYATTAGRVGTAPGQLTVDELKNVYRINSITNDTMITGLVGSPVLHSVSPHMHNAAFADRNLNGVYLPFHVDDLSSFLGVMVTPASRELGWNLRGLSITAPHKTKILEYLDRVDPMAQQVGAVNTVVLENEQLCGYNTDADGFIEPLVRRIGSLSGARAAVIGAGGAANAAVFALKQRGVDVTLYVRDLNRAKSICERFNICCELLSPVEFAGADLVINTTPLGSFGESVNDTPALASQLQRSSFVYDLVYNPIETRFMREGRAAGCHVLGGLEMLVEQARLQFKLWTNTNVSYELMYSAGSAALAKLFSEKL